MYIHVALALASARMPSALLADKMHIYIYIYIHIYLALASARMPSALLAV